MNDARPSKRAAKRRRPGSAPGTPKMLSSVCRRPLTPVRSARLRSGESSVPTPRGRNGDKANANPNKWGLISVNHVRSSRSKRADLTSRFAARRSGRSAANVKEVGQALSYAWPHLGGLGHLAKPIPKVGKARHDQSLLVLDEPFGISGA